MNKGGRSEDSVWEHSGEADSNGTWVALWCV